MKRSLGVALVMFAGGCANMEVAAQDSVDLNLTTRHTSVFNKIDYRIPKGWVVIDGESDWVAAHDDKQFWAPGFEVDRDAYYAVSTVLPYLTMEDMRDKRVRSLDEIAAATLHALQVSVSAVVQQPARRFRIKDYDAVSFETSTRGTHVQYQIFIALENGKVASVAGNGPRAQLNTIRALVNAIAETVKPEVRK